MCVMTYYDTQKFNLHHGSFGGAKGMGIGAWTISTSAFITSSNWAGLRRYLVETFAACIACATCLARLQVFRLDGLITYELNATYWRLNFDPIIDSKNVIIWTSQDKSSHLTTSTCDSCISLRWLVSCGSRLLRQRQCLVLAQSHPRILLCTLVLQQARRPR
jgi:hypothetical protein